MIPKITGYLLAGVGILGIATPLVPQIATYVPIPETVPSLYLTIGSLILVGMGLAIIMSKNRSPRKSRQMREVPIYEGREIVGYRRN